VQLTFDHKQHSEKGKENKKQQRGPEKPKKKEVQTKTCEKSKQTQEACEFFWCNPHRHITFNPDVGRLKAP